MELKELCAKYGENISTMSKRCHDGVLPARKIKNHWNINVKDYLKWKSEQEKLVSHKKQHKAMQAMPLRYVDKSTKLRLRLFRYYWAYEKLPYTS